MVGRREWLVAQYQEDLDAETSLTRPPLIFDPIAHWRRGVQSLAGGGRAARRRGPGRP